MKSIFALLPHIQGTVYDAQIIFSREENSDNVAMILELQSKKTKESFLYELAVLKGALVQKDTQAQDLLARAFIAYVNGDYTNGNDDALLVITAQAVASTVDILYMLGDVIYQRQGNCDNEIEDEIINDLDGVVANAMIKHMNEFMNLNIELDV